MLATVVNVQNPKNGQKGNTAMILEVNDDGFIMDRYPDETIDGFYVDVTPYTKQLGVFVSENAVYNGRTGLITDT